MAFLSIPFVFTGCNLRHNETVCGMPSMTAIAGMAINAERVLSEMGMPSLRVNAFSWVLFSLDRDQHAPRRPAQEVRKGQAILPALMDIRRGHGEAALVLNLCAKESSDYTRLCQFLLDEPQCLSSRLETELTMAGGDVFLGLPGEFQLRPLSLGLYEQFSDVLKAYLRSYPTKGLLIQDMSHQLSEQAVRFNKVPLDALLDCLYASQQQRSPHAMRQQQASQTVEAPVTSMAIENIADPIPPTVDDLWGDLFDHDFETLADEGASTFEDQEDVEEEQDSSLLNDYQGILIPTAIGYHEICPSQGQRYIVEPVISLVRARVLASALKELKEHPHAWEKQCWAWQHLPAYRLYRAISPFNLNETDNG